MGLPSDKSLLVGLGAAGAVIAIHNNLTPNLTDLRAALPGDSDAQGAERAATLLGAALVTGLAAITKDATVFVIGGTVVVAMAWAYRYADNVDPRSTTAGPTSAPAVDDSPAIMEDEGVVAYSA